MWMTWLWYLDDILLLDTRVNNNIKKIKKRSSHIVALQEEHSLLASQ